MHTFSSKVAPMKTPDWTYDLHVIGTRPRNLALEEFGELVKRLSDLLGSQEHIRFEGLKAGSASIRVKVLEPATQQVQSTLVAAALLHDSSGLSRVKRIDEYLASKGWHAELRNRQGRVLVTFSGAAATKPSDDVRTVQQLDSMIGTVIKIGGRDETVPMQVQTADGRYVDVTVRGRDLARQLGSLLFEEVRLFGVATWQRDAEGTWTFSTMTVDRFDQPSVQRLEDLFNELGELPGNEWNLMDDPEAEWLKIRRGDQ
jgi:hypothetical protein